MENIQFDEKAKVTLYNPLFDVMRNELNIAIQQTVAEMVEKDMSAAAIGLKIDITTGRRMIADRYAATGMREAMSIMIGYKVGSTLQAKSETKGDVVSKTSPKELVLDDLGNLYMVSHEEASGQMCMFNSWDEYRQAMMQ